MCLYPGKFLWPDLMSFWDGKSEANVSECTQILAKMAILTDPGAHMSQLLDALAMRGLFSQLLQQAGTIKLTLPRLVALLEKLVPLESQTIRTCLQAEPDKWETLAMQSSEREELKDSHLTSEQVKEFYEKETAQLPDKVPLEDLHQLSRRVSDEVQEYRHCDYQAAIAAIALSQKKPFVVVVSPTASGKTWIQGLIAKYLCEQGLSVTVVEPNEHLRVQTTEKLAVVDYGIAVTSIDMLYREGPWGQVMILNEYDMIATDRPYSVQQQGIQGLWQLKGKQVFAFSATSSASYERLLTNCVARPTVLKFKSEYELVHGSSPIADATIVPVADTASMLTALEVDLCRFYDQRPVIIISSKE